MEKVDHDGVKTISSFKEPREAPVEATTSRSSHDSRDPSVSVIKLDVANQDKPKHNENSPLVHFASESSQRSSRSSQPYSRRPFRDKHNDSTNIQSTMNLRYPSGLDFERVVNQFSVEALRERYLFAEHRNSVGGVLPPHNKEYDTFEDELRDSFSTTQMSDRASLQISGVLQQKPHMWGYTGRTAIGWGFTILTGLLTGAMAILLASLTDIIRNFRSGYINILWKNEEKGITIFLAYAGTNLALALLSSMLCLFLSPNAVGSGIPEVKAYLNGVRVERFSSFRLLFVKVIGTILSVSSDLAIGPEGPLVQIGAIMGAACTKLPNFICRWFSAGTFSHRFWKFVTIDLSHFSTDEERRILVSIGSAAGFAAAFGTPIGGLLFSMEEASTYFQTSMFVKTLAATAIATFLLSVYHGNLSDFSIISMGNYDTPNDNLFLNRVEEFPLYFVVAVIGGIMGGLFCRWWKFLQLWRRRFFPSKVAQNRWKLKEVALVSLITSSLMYWIPTMDWPCRAYEITDDIVEGPINVYLDLEEQFDCQPGHINELAAIFFGSREDAITDILTNPNQFNPMTLWVTGLVFFFCMTLTLGVALPSGIFMPTFLIGASLGGASGILFQNLINEDISPSVFALLGAAALLAGIQRTTVSICVILVEGTGQVKTLIPVIFTVMVAKYVGDLISHHGLYELAMEVKQYPFLEVNKFPKLYDIFSVRQIMSSPPLTLGPREKAHTIVRLLRESVHNGFPVVDPKTKCLLGLVRRDQLVALLECGIFEKSVEMDEQDADEPRTADKASISDRKGLDGWGSSPMFNLAYHIKDGRYSHVEDQVPGTPKVAIVAKKDKTLVDSSYNNDASKAASTRAREEDAQQINELLDEKDAFDNNAWFVATRNAQKHFEETAKGIADESMRTVEDSMPLPNTRNMQQHFFVLDKRENSATPSLKEIVATVALNERGNIYIDWMDPEYENSWVPVGDVMNLGIYSVRETVPVSKAYRLFTELGLRHLVVIGGESGGAVVGILTRINFLQEFVEERTGCAHLQ